jgi:polar amino acid transport system substrate-binding protein/arginine/ornithine transport system substrate-binding protein
MRAVLFAVLIAAAVRPAVAEEIVVCVEGAYPPFSWTNDEGEVEGFDIDIAHALCAEMGATCRMAPTEWDAIIPSLEADRCDAIIASMAITAERKQRVDFSAPYQTAPIRFVAAEGAGLVDTPEGMAGRRVCIQRGTVHQDYLEATFPATELVLYPTHEEMLLDLAAGRCDAAMADAVSLTLGFLDAPEGEGFALFGRDHLDPAFHGEGSGVAVRKTDTALRDRFSAAIAAIRGNGVYKAINDRYFPFDMYGG